MKLLESIWPSSILSSRFPQISLNYLICNHRNVYIFQNSLIPWYSFFFFSWRLITLQYCSGFCHTLTWISHGFTCVPHPESPSHLPPHPPSGSSPCTSPEHLSHAPNLDWWSVSYLIIYMFRGCSLISSHLAFSHRVQKSVLYICVSFSVLHIGLSLPSF